MKTRKQTYKLLVFLLLMLFMPQCFPASVKATSWLEGWSYRKSCTINFASGAGIGYQINVTAFYGSGTDSAYSFYLNSKCRTDFGDVRWADDDGITLLYYYVQTKTDGDNALFWVKIADNLNSSSAAIYVYYGKADATNISNGDGTFIFFDDFIGDALDTDKWIVREGDVTVSDGQLILTGTSGTRGRIDGVTTFGSNVAYHTKARVSATIPPLYSILMGMRNDPTFTDSVVLYYTDGWWLHSRANNATSETGAGMWYYSTVNWATYKIEWIPSIIKLYQNDSFCASKTNNVPTVPLRCYNREPLTVDGEVYVDWIFVRKFVSPEPTQDSWGVEEDYVPKGSLTQMINYYAIMLPIIGVSASVFFIVMFFSIAASMSGNADTNEVFTKAVFAVLTVGILLVAMVILNALTV